ncbi:MAG: DUF4340 domain-containing protein [Undibacterium sp.]|nr:DUF4340 domain-containing protein [Opitutaceae bacterium]
MKLKSLLLIVAALAALSVVVFIIRRPASPASTDARQSRPLLDAATADRVAEIRLTEAGKSVILTRDAAGTWHVPAYYDFTADFSKIARFISELTDAKITRLVTTSPDRIARLEFKDTPITLLDSGAKQLWTATLGKSAETGGGRFLRFGAESKAYLTSLNTYLDLDPKNWANPELLALKPDDITKIEIPFSPAAASAGDPASITFTRAKKEDPWTTTSTPAGQKLKPEALTPTLTALTSLRFSETTDLTDANAIAAKANERLFKLETFDGKVIKIALGRKPEEKKIKPPVADAKNGLAALGTATDLAKQAAEGKPADPTKPIVPEFETIPAGPVFVNISHSEGAAAPVNVLMQKRAFQIADYTFTSLPQKASDLFEPAAIRPPAGRAPVPSEPK